MPSNIQHENISAAKLGIETISKGYIGHEEVYPNTREIQSAAFTSTSTLSNAGGTRLFRVTGDIGSTYSLTGYGAGSYTLLSSPYDHSISVTSNNGCGDPSRTILTTLTPTGSTLLQGGGSTFASSFTQSAGPSQTNYNFGVSVTVTNTNYVTSTYNGTLGWGNGATFTVSYSGNNNSPASFQYTTTGAAGASTATGSLSYSNISGTLTPGSSTTVAPGAFSGSYTVTNTHSWLGFLRASVDFNNGGSTVSCVAVTGGNNGPGSNFSSNLYP